MFAEDEAGLLIEAAATPDDLIGMVERRVRGLPLEHILGWAEFCALRIAVDPGVFVPRRRTEFLARQALYQARRAGAPAGPGPVVVELCCGSGAIGAVLCAALPAIELHAADIDPAAVACARRNLAAAGAVVYQGDLYQPLPAGLRGRAHVLVSNAPYVPTGEFGLLPPEARVYEPRAALDGGEDGLDVLRRVIAGAPEWLAPGGCVLVETSEEQAARLVDAARRANLRPEVATSTESYATVVTAYRA